MESDRGKKESTPKSTFEKKINIGLDNLEESDDSSEDGEEYVDEKFW